MHDDGFSEVESVGACFQNKHFWLGVHQSFCFFHEVGDLQAVFSRLSAEVLMGQEHHYFLIVQVAEYGSALPRYGGLVLNDPLQSHIGWWNSLGVRLLV